MVEKGMASAFSLDHPYEDGKFVGQCFRTSDSESLFQWGIACFMEAKEEQLFV
jgi:hypothetical protein